MMHMVRCNVEMWWCNAIKFYWIEQESPKFLSEKLLTFEEKKSAIKAIWFKILLGSIITTRSHLKEDSIVGCKIMSRCIDFGSPVVNCYA
jgi:hypothetical protein